MTLAILALETGLKLKSSETGFIHISDRIPLTENFLFSLALLRTKASERVLEARDLIDKLLHFQLPSGNFPLYLHEYPLANDRFIGAKILIPVHWILTQFGSVLGGDLRNRLIVARDQLCRYLSGSHEDLPSTHFLHTLIQILCEQMVPSPSIEQEGIYHVPAHFGFVLAAAQTVDSSLSSMLPFLSSHTHSSTLAYSGPGLSEYHNKSEPAVTLFDLYIAQLTGLIPKRMKELSPILLWGAVVYPTGATFEAIGSDVSICQSAVPENRAKGKYDFRYQWGNPDRIHSLVCQGGNIRNWKHENGLYQFFLGDLQDEMSREVTLYLDHQPTTISVNGQAATTFNLNEKVEIRTEEKVVRFLFSSEGSLVGHIMRGNRPAQIDPDRFQAFDWVVFLRTLYRSDPCTVTLRLEME